MSNMTKENIRIIFMGTPDFAVASLCQLVETGYNVVAVVTMPDKPAGRGHKLQSSPVKQYAQSMGIPVLQPTNLKDETFIKELASYNADLQIVVAFRMLPQVVWGMPSLGTFNLHGSLLPQYRGAAPIQWAVINGEKVTGVTTFMLQHEIDTGDILLQEAIDIGPDENCGSVHDRLMEIGKHLVTKTVDLIIDCYNNNKVLPKQKQTDDCALKPAPKLFKDNCAIDFNKPAIEIKNMVRGLSPYPAAWIAQQPIINGSLASIAPHLVGAKIYKAEISIVAEQKGHIIVSCADGYIDLLEIQLPGKKRMAANALLNGLTNT